ncbi:MAG: efflux RND transporter periplasmic adaptor subunit [Desulfatibacillaceae bacterium]
MGRNIHGSKFRAFVFAAAAAAVVLFSAGCKPGDTVGGEAGASPAPVQERIVRVHTTRVEPLPLEDILVLPGETEAANDVLVSADTDGVVESIGVAEGGRVEQGQLIARIDVEALKSVLDRARSAYELAEGVCRRREKLFAKDLVTEEEMDRVSTECALAKSQLRQAEIEYERGFLKSPVSGIVNSLMVDEGEFVRRGSVAAEVVNVDRIIVNVNVPELDVRWLSVGDRVDVVVDAYPNRGFTGIVDFIAYKADPATKTFPVKVLIDNPDHVIRPGMIARARFVRRTIPDAVVAPLFALVDRNGERLVYVMEDGVAKGRVVEIGVIRKDMVQITDGLEPGDQLIVVGQTEVEEGVKVEARNP